MANPPVKHAAAQGSACVEQAGGGSHAPAWILGGSPFLRVTSFIKPGLRVCVTTCTILVLHVTLCVHVWAAGWPRNVARHNQGGRPVHIRVSRAGPRTKNFLS